jgi:Phosphoesterase family
MNYHLKNSSFKTYTYYQRKNNPFVNYDSIATVPRRARLMRNFNDLAYDLNASSIPQFVWHTPNIVNNAHDTDVHYMAAWIDYWLLPLLQSPSFNDPKTLILLTFDETNTNGINNHVYGVLLGNAIPQQLRGSVDHTYYTLYSILSTVEANWGLKSLGRHDTNK